MDDIRFKLIDDRFLCLFGNHDNFMYILEGEPQDVDPKREFEYVISDDKQFIDLIDGDLHLRYKQLDNETLQRLTKGVGQNEEDREGRHSKSA